MKRKIVMIGTVLMPILIADVVTKRWALDALAGGRRLELLDGALPLTLAFNTGAAFSLSLGGASRWLFVLLTAAALIALAALYRQAKTDDTLRLTSIAIVTAGALGNLVDRLRWDLGVVDFIGPIDLGFMHWPIFNVADIAITCGAALLAISLWREEPVESPAAEGAAGTEYAQL